MKFQSTCRPSFYLICLLVALVSRSIVSVQTSLDEKNKFRVREASDDSLGYPEREEDSLVDSQCPMNLELRWQAEVSSSVYATPLIADINGDGKLDIVVPTFVHYLEVLEGADGDKMPGWPAFHQSTTYSSPLLYDIDKDGVREVALATYNGQILFFRVSGFLMHEKLEVPRRKVKKNWYVGLKPDPVDRSHPDVHDDELNDRSTLNKSVSNSQHLIYANETSQRNSEIETNGSSTSVPAEMNSTVNNNFSSQVPSVDIRKELENNSSISQDLNSTVVANNSSAIRRILEAKVNENNHLERATVHNKDGLEADADSSFDLLRDGDDVGEDYTYDYEDYGNEDAWGEEGWTEMQHELLEDLVDIDSHILCTPVIADIDNDGDSEMVVAVSHYFDREYYSHQEHLKELGDIDITKYAAGSLVVFNLDSKQVKWKKELDISTTTSQYSAYLHSSPTVADLDGDGFMDILLGTSFGLFYVFNHLGEIRDNFPLTMAEIQGSVVAADINDDGKIELLTTDSHGNVAAWTSQGKEIWETHLKSLIPHGPTIGDVDGDGHTDVVVPTMSGKIYVLDGKDGSLVRPYPYAARGRVMNQVLLVDLKKRGETRKGLTMVTSSFDGYLYVIDGPTSCADVVDIGETAYSMVLADNVDGGDDLDLVVSTMNGNVLCFSTPSTYHPLKAWRSSNHGRNNAAYGYDREGVYVTTPSRAFRDEEGKSFWVEIEIVDKHRQPSGYHAPYNVTTTLMVPGNYEGDRVIRVSQMYDLPGKHKIKLPTVAVRTGGSVLVEMVDRNGLYFYDDFSLTFHIHYYKLLKWLIALPMLGMFGFLVVLRPRQPLPLPSFSRNTNL